MPSIKRMLRICTLVSYLITLNLSLRWFWKDNLITSPFSSSKSRLYDISTDSINNPRISDVVIPLVPTQLPLLMRRLRLWDKFPPCPSSNDFLGLTNLQERASYSQAGRNIRLTFFSSRQIDSKLERAITRTFHNLKPSTQSCFSSINFVFAGLKGQEDSYKLGTRIMFEMFLDNRLRLDKPYYVLFMEPDVLPVRDYWLTALDATCRRPNTETFWIKGSLYRGGDRQLSRHAISSATHINGNAIYNLYDPRLRHFYYRYIKPIHQKNQRHRTAYDQDFFLFLAHPANFETLQRVAHQFQYTAMIQNWWRWNYSVPELLEQDELVYLVHGGKPYL